MKKFVIGLLVLCLVIVGVLGLTDTDLRSQLGIQSIVSEGDGTGEPASAGIIGGADGPTAVWVAEGGEADAEASEPESTEAAQADAAEEPAESPSTEPDEPSTASGRLNYEIGRAHV